MEYTLVDVAKYKLYNDATFKPMECDSFALINTPIVFYHQASHPIHYVFSYSTFLQFSAFAVFVASHLFTALYTLSHLGV